MHTNTPARLCDRSIPARALKERLRATHFGIDKEIQDLLDALMPWYRFAETQQRPRTIGLWGMTGTGKSSLVRAMVKELGLEDRTYWLDAGECHSRGWLEEVFQRLEEHLNGAPFILVVDEFQHARTVVNGQATKEPGELRRFWELLDAGRVVTWPRHFRGLTGLIDFRARFIKAIEAGAVVHGGQVVKGLNSYRTMVWKHYEMERGERWAVPKHLWSEFRDMSGDPAPSMSEIEGLLSGMDAEGVLRWMDALRAECQRARLVDASKSLILLLGNLDELYVSEKEPLAELDPDVLMHRHRDIGRAGVQHALMDLFRIEQVARIGTSHVVFPPIGMDTIQRMVHKETRELAERLAGHCGLAVTVEATLLEHVVRSSPIAVMGARPVVEAVQHLLPLLLGQVMDHPLGKEAKAVRLGVGEDGPFAGIDVGTDTQRLTLRWPDQGSSRFPLPSVLERTAVHEAGHLLCGVRLCGMRPLQVCARTRDPLVGGFVAWDRRPDGPVLRSEVVPQLAAMLGGWAAEYLHYGEEGVSSYSRNDLEQATSFALEMLKRRGLGNHRLHHAEYSVAPGDGIRTLLPEVEALARQWMEQAEALAVATLRNERDLFERCVAELIGKGSLGMKELEGLVGGGALQMPQDDPIAAVSAAAG
jgi:hypothetical protein